jgi:hypothetical protein
MKHTHGVHPYADKMSPLTQAIIEGATELISQLGLERNDPHQGHVLLFEVTFCDEISETSFRDDLRYARISSHFWNGQCAVLEMSIMALRDAVKHPEVKHINVIPYVRDPSRR